MLDATFRGGFLYISKQKSEKYLINNYIIYFNIVKIPDNELKYNG